MSQISFACTALMGTNKVGELKASDDGYYTMVLGALDFFNSAGQFYPNGASAQELFKASSSFMRRIASGALRGEYGHPRMQPNQSMRDFMYRCNDILETNVSHHIRKVWIDYTSVKSPDGRPCIAIMGEVKPAGPMGNALRESLQNPSENVCFSIRSFTRDVPTGGIIHKHLMNIVTWDYVNEPGISVATKWKSPTLESHEESEVTLSHLVAAQELSRASGASLESHGGLALEELIEQVRQINLDAAKRPPSANW